MEGLIQAISAQFLLCSSSLSAATIVLDSGHEPSLGGATASCLKKEFEYNDEVVGVLSSALKGHTVILTRAGGKDIDTNDTELPSFLSEDAKKKWPQKKGLLARAAVANKARADVFISIHHDSVPEPELSFDAKLCQDKGGMRVKSEFRRKHDIGFSVFVYDNGANATRERSIALARSIGRRLKDIGRIPSDHHIKPFEPCESCRVVDAALGVYNQDLVVLNSTRMPAVLIEVGNILDPDDEKHITSPLFRKQFTDTLVSALNDYLFQDPVRLK